MPVHPDVFKDVALRHVKQGSSRPPGRLTADELPPMAASWATTAKLPVGSWKEHRPRYQRGLSPCLAHCPVGNDIEGFVSRLREGDEEGAARLLAAENPFPAVCGRVCYHPCEMACNRVHHDSAVGIRGIERYLGDGPCLNGESVWQAARSRSGRRVAVVGSGPGGLGCAWGLALLGHSVEVFERADNPGGLLLRGIPSYRLPKEILGKEIDRIRALGVRFSCGIEVGAVRELGTLLDRYDAVFVAAGAVRSRPLGISGKESGGCLSALEFLAGLATHRPVDIGRDCLVIGGGNSAVDAARSARRLGAEVTLVYRRSRAEMPAHADEIEDALAEGVRLMELAVPHELVLEDGKLTGLNCLRTRLGEPDESGRRAPVPVPNSSYMLRASTVINALGEEVDRKELTGDQEFQRALTELDPWGASGVEGLFAGGDFAGTERTVAHALGSGKRAAMAIDRYLSGQNVDPLERYRVGGGPASFSAYLSGEDSEILAEGIQTIHYEDLNQAYLPRVERTILLRQLESTPESDFREVEKGFTACQANQEAGRCFSCGRCTQCGLCQIYCPEGAVLRLDAAGGGLSIFDSHCKGCGICVEECPRCAIRMEPKP